MTRSILWISSRAPSSPFSITWVALPQPRSRMALAADTRAAAVASFDRMTPTRTLSAVLVWLRASERISVTDLVIGHAMAELDGGWNILARRGVDMVHGQIVGTSRRPKCNGRKIGRRALVLRSTDELNNFCAHENPSQTAIATRLAKASDIRYTVMPASLLKMRHCRACPGNRSGKCILRRLMDARIKSGHDEN